MNLKCLKERKGLIGRSWQDNIHIYLRYAGCGAMEWIDLAEGIDQCERSKEPSGSVTCYEVLGQMHKCHKCKIETRPLVREGALHEEASTCQTKGRVISGHGP
jgi:hypothetical protein